jgi:NADPH:quinone reductase-like Zn-dependent oxidoreductase
VLLEVERSVVDVGHANQALATGKTKVGWEHPSWCSMIGRVAEVGGAADKLQIGDRVSAIGPAASRVLLPAEACLEVPDTVEAGKAVYWALLSALVRSARQLGIELGESALVLGGGLTGRLLAELSMAAGAARVMGLDATRSADSPNQPYDGPAPTPMWYANMTTLRKELPDEVDVLIDVLGDFGQLYQVLPLVRAGGRVLSLAANDAPPVEFDFYPNIHRRSLKLIGATLQQSLAEEMASAREIAFINHLLQNGRLSMVQRPAPEVHPDPAGEQTMSTVETASLIIRWDKAHATG